MNTDKAVVLLEAISLGLQVRIGPSTYQVIKGSLYKATQESYWLLRKECMDKMVFSDFLKLAKNMTEDELQIAKGSIIVKKVSDRFPSLNTQTPLS